MQPEEHQAWAARGKALSSLERYEEAIASYDRALEIQPDYHHAWNGRGKALNGLGRYKEAIASYDRALELHPNYPSIWIEKGVALYRLGNHKQAFKCFSRVTAIQPDDRNAWNNQGYLTLAQYAYGSPAVFDKPLLIRQTYNAPEIEENDCWQALEFFDRALSIDFEYSIAWANRSFPAYYLKQYQIALNNCDKALELNADDKEKFNEVVYTNRGCILLKLRDPTAAISSFDAALEIDRNLAEAWVGKGIALGQLGRTTEADRCFQSAIALNDPLATASIPKSGY